MDLHEILLASKIVRKNGSADLSDYYTKSQTDSRISEKVAEIVANAPDDFDTLKEISDWIAGHEDSAAAMNTAIAANTTAVAQKVDKVSGKGLSANDFTTDLKTKLNSLENYDDTEVKADIADALSGVAINKTTLGYQSKNLLMNNCKSTTKNGITATVNADGSITFNGTSTSSNMFTLFFNMETGSTSSQYTNNKKWIPNGRYILSTGQTTDVGVYLHVAFSTDNESESRYVSSGSVGKVEFNVTDADKYVWARIRIGASASFDNVTIYPMIRPAEITDSTYEPYRPSVAEYMANHIVTLDSVGDFENLTNKTAEFYFIREEQS